MTYKMMTTRFLAKFWMGISQVFYTLALIWNFVTNAGFDILIYITGFILAVLYMVTGSLMK